jgi:heme-degrading monooxygenase HmoA
VIEVLFRYTVHPAQVRAFEHAYGPAGPWAAFFAKHRGYLRTRLFRHRDEDAVYISMDVWETKVDYDAFRAQNAEEYARLDRSMRLLYLEELLLGYYEGEDEYA